MWIQWYKVKPALTWLFLIAAGLMIGAFLYFANGTVQQLDQFSSQTAERLEQEERAKMQIWAEAYRQLNRSEVDADISLELKIIQANTTIPVFYTDVDGTLLGSNNIEIPEDTAMFLADKIPELKEKGNFIEINITPEDVQYLYYDESNLLRELYAREASIVQRVRWFPWVQIVVIVIFVLLFFYVFASQKRFEQNRVWVGLSKETAHQLGTPISSLMAWMDYLRSVDTDAAIVDEMDKDVQRLHTVAERFSKIGSEPKMEDTDLVPIVRNAAVYMQKRAPKHITIDAVLPEGQVIRPLSGPLFSWVIENLCRNAIDAMRDGRGYIRITLDRQPNGKAFIEVEDNGKGIAKKNQKDVFRAGYTTKSRGWGLGLTLVKRIVEEYHHGKIFVKSSQVGMGTTFRIEM